MFNDVTAASFQALWSRPHFKWTENRWRPSRAISWGKTCTEPAGSEQEEQKVLTRHGVRHIPRSATNRVRFAQTKEVGWPHDEALLGAAAKRTRQAESSPREADRRLWSADSLWSRSRRPSAISESGYRQKRRGGQAVLWTRTSGLSQCGLSPGPGSIGGGETVDW